MLHPVAAPLSSASEVGVHGADGLPAGHRADVEEHGICGGRVQLKAGIRRKERVDARFQRRRFGQLAHHDALRGLDDHRVIGIAARAAHLEVDVQGGHPETARAGSGGEQLHLVIAGPGVGGAVGGLADVGHQRVGLDSLAKPVISILWALAAEVHVVVVLAFARVAPVSAISHPSAAPLSSLSEAVVSVLTTCLLAVVPTSITT